MHSYSVEYPTWSHFEGVFKESLGWASGFRVQYVQKEAPLWGAVDLAELSWKEDSIASLYHALINRIGDNELHYVVGKLHSPKGWRHPYVLFQYLARRVTIGEKRSWSGCVHIAVDPVVYLGLIGRLELVGTRHITSLLFFDGYLFDLTSVSPGDAMAVHVTVNGSAPPPYQSPPPSPPPTLWRRLRNSLR